MQGLRMFFQDLPIVSIVVPFFGLPKPIIGSSTLNPKPRLEVGFFKGLGLYKGLPFFFGAASEVSVLEVSSFRV